MKEEVVLVGGGGHCKSVIEVIESTNKFSIVGILDIPSKKGEKILGYEVIGSDEDIPFFAKKSISFVITAGQVKSPNLRIKLVDLVKNVGGKLPVIIAATAYVSKFSNIGEGTVVMHQSFINANVHIGKHNIINTKTIIEHDATIGDFCHISTGVILNGSVAVGNNNFIGSGSVVNNNVSIGCDNIIASATVVKKIIGDKNLVSNRFTKQF